MTSKTLTIKLKNECTIYEVSEKHQHIMEKWANKKQAINLDLSAVTEMDSCFIQLLMSCKKTAAENAADCRLINPSEEVGEKFKGFFAEELLEN
jgi:anti-anti-sigma factor